MHFGPRTEPADFLHAMKYRGPGEDYREYANRVAYALQDDDRHYKEFREILLDMRFWPGGRVQAAMGTSAHVTPWNCFVSGALADSFVTGAGCIEDRHKEAAATLRLGGGIGYDFSTLRPEGDLIKAIQTAAGGPVRFLPLFDVLADIITAKGHRHGAQMGILRVDHPDIEAFIRVKQNDDRLRRFNLSIAVTDEFMEAVDAGRDFDLRFQGRVYRTIHAPTLWESVMRSTWDWGEPGVVFIDRINQMNNLWYCETIAATNPCAEQPLPPYGACLLGSVCLPRYLIRESPIIVKSGVADPYFGGWSFDFDRLRADLPHIVRAMDNVIDRGRYPLPEQKAEGINKRRMGIGVMGLANAAEACGHPYGSAGFRAFESQVLNAILVECYKASALLAKQKGSFTLFDSDRYLAGQFVKTLPGDVRELIARHGMRNSHLTSIAPTGTISMCADNVTGGIEPVFDFEIDRLVDTPAGKQMFKVKDYAYNFLGVSGRRAHEVTAMEHIDVLATAQCYVDSAVSKTVNVAGSMPWPDFKALYRSAFEKGAKSCSTFNQDGKRGGLLTASELAKPAEPAMTHSFTDGGGETACSLTGSCE